MNPTNVEPHDVKVSVTMITYNHEQFIAQAIESVMMQQADFAFELIIGEDCSTDRTRAIVIEYAQRYPERIRPLLHDRNLGMMGNHLATLEACRGQYIAYLEGDDYWLSPHKLRTQVEYLNSHSSCALCCHDVLVVHENGNRTPERYRNFGENRGFSLEDMILTNPVATCSVMYRRRLLGELPEWYQTLGMGDRPLYVLLAQHGNICYLDEVMAVYRVHQGGVFTSRSYDRRWHEEFRMFEALRSHLGPRYAPVIAKAKCNLAAELLTEKAKAAPSFQEGVAIVHETLDQWQAAYGLPDAWRSQALGRVYAAYLFSSRTGQIDRRDAGRCIVGMVRHDPTWLRNAGVWSLAADAFLGRTATGWLRRTASAGRIQLQRSKVA